MPGFVLRYAGKKFNQDNPPELSNLQKLQENFGSLGALVMRFQFCQAQPAALIQQITETNYKENAIQEIATGNNQTDLFKPINNSDSAFTTNNLKAYSHYPIGRGKILNERGQPQLYPNTKDLYGGQAAWDDMHFAVWSVGINLAYQLSHQGFLYIHHPANTTAQDYEKITHELEAQNFTLEQSQDKTVVKTASGLTLTADRIPINSQIELDPSLSRTYQPNGFVIKAGDSEAPVGWIIHSKNKKLLDREFAENLLRVIRNSKPGFHRLDEEQQNLLRQGYLQSNEATLFTENPTFNALNIILEVLEKEHDFDSSQLLSDKTLQRLYSKVQDNAAKKEMVEDLLTLHLITEMTQLLKFTSKMSTREGLPRNLADSFKALQNTETAFAYAFDLPRKDGKSAVKMGVGDPCRQDEDLVDSLINGKLRNPKLTNPKHTSALLSTAILSAEQMLIEQLLRDACQHGSNHPNAHALQKILNNDSLYKELLTLAKDLPSNRFGPILGLQFDYCEPIIERIRKALGHDKLAQLASQLYQSNEPAICNAETVFALKHLFEIGEVLQNLEAISVSDLQSRGINAGLNIVIKKLVPSLYDEMKLQGRIIKPYPAITRGEPQDSNNKRQTSIESCPYLSGFFAKKAEQSKPPKKEETPHPDVPPKQVSSWCNYFGNWKTASKVAAAVALAGTVYATNNFLKKR